MYKTKAAARGNALFLILIAVALFAALSYAITQSGKGGGGGASKEKLELDAARFIAYMGEIRTAYQRMILSGIDPATIQAYNAPQSWNSTDTPCSTGTACLFSTTGGGVAWQGPPSKFYTPVTGGGIDPDKFYTYSMTNSAGNAVSVSGIGSTSPETLIMTFYVPYDFCTAINRHLGLPDALSLPVTSTPGDPNSGPWTLDSIPGADMGCWRDEINYQEIRNFYIVLAAN